MAALNAARRPQRASALFESLGALQLHGNLCSFNTAMKSRSMVEDWRGAIELLEARQAGACRRRQVMWTKLFTPNIISARCVPPCAWSCEVTTPPYGPAGKAGR